MLRLLAFSFLSTAFCFTACADPAPAAPTTTVAPAAAPTTPETKPAAPAEPAKPATAETPAAAAPTQPTPPAAPAPVKVSYNRCNVDGPYIAITFDDGPHGANTPRLLEMLRQRGIKATFFLVGECVAEYPEIVKQIVKEGHEVGNHSWNHPNLLKLSAEKVEDQIDRTHNVITQEAGAPPTIFRPPYGNFTEKQRQWAHDKWGYTTIIWDVDSLDWKHRNPAKTESIILSTTHAGSIILCHDIHKTTIDAMPSVLDKLLAKGFKFVTVSELIKMNHEVPPTPKAPKKTLTAKPEAKSEDVAKAKSTDKSKVAPQKKTTTSSKKTAKG